MLRGRRSVTLDLKSSDGKIAALALAERADALIEGFRPGVIERLGLGPDVLLARNPRLVVGRVTGWGQDGPLAARAGHDINYIALSGALHAIGRADERPVPPLNLVGDFGGGGMLLAYGIVCALLEAQRSGRGQVVDAAMIDGASLLTTMFWGMAAAKQWSERRGDNVLDGAAPWYDTYETRDGKPSRSARSSPSSTTNCCNGWVSRRQHCPHSTTGPAGRCFATASRSVFATRTRDEWGRAFDGSDACVAPVLTFAEAARHPHNVARRGHAERRRHRSAGAGTTTVANAVRLARIAAGARRARRRGVAGLGLHPGRDRRAARAGTRVLGVDRVSGAARWNLHFIHERGRIVIPPRPRRMPRRFAAPVARFRAIRPVHAQHHAASPPAAARRRLPRAASASTSTRSRSARGSRT